MLKALSLSILTYSLLIVVNTALEARGRVKVPLCSMLMGCIVKIPIEYMLLSSPEVGIMGAVYSTNIAYAIALFVSLMFTLKEGVFPFSGMLTGGAYLLCAYFSASLSVLIYRGALGEVENRLHTLLIIPIFAVIYILLSMFVFVFKYIFDKKCQFAQNEPRFFR
jgi:stage V sporulation protein B